MKAWTKVLNFRGEDLSHYYIGITRGRDSNVLSNSNFEALLGRLGGESRWDPANPAADLPVLVGRFGHWSCGWVEQILVHETAYEKLKILEQALRDLEDSPVLDEDDFRERERAHEEVVLKAYANDFSQAVCEFAGVAGPINESEKAQMEDLTRGLYKEACSHYGSEDAFVSVGNIPALLKNLDEFAEFTKADGNKFLTACLTKISQGQPEGVSKLRTGS